MERRESGCRFVVRRFLHHVSRFTLMSERLDIIRVKAKLFKISLNCAHAPSEEKDDVVKDARLEVAYDRCPAHEVKIIIEDFNEKVRRQRIFAPGGGASSASMRPSRTTVSG